MNNAAHRVVVNTGILYGRMAITVFLSLYTTRVILNALGTEDFGIFNLVAGTIAMLAFLNASMAAATQRFMSFAQGQGDELRQRSIFNVSVVLHAIIAIVILGLLEGAGYILFNGVLQIEPERMHAAWMVYQFAAASMFFTILSVPYDAVINARENMLLFAVLGVVEAFLKLGVAIFIANVASDKLVVYGLLMAALSVVLLLLRIAYCHVRYQECKLAPSRYITRPLFKEMTSFAGWSFFGTSSSMVANYGQGLVLNMFFGAKVNAAQAVAGQVSGQLSAFASTMLRALNPVITKSEGAGNRELMLKVSITGGKANFFLLMLFYVPVIVEMPYLFELWLKNVPEFAIIFSSLLLLRNMVEQLFVTLVSSIAAVGNIKNYQIVSSSLTLFPLLVSYVLFQVDFPPYALYIVFLVYSVVMSAVILYFSKKCCSLSIQSYLRDVVARCFLAFLLAIAVSASPLLMLEHSVLRFMLVVALSFLSFLATVWWIGLSAEEKGIAKRLFINLLRFLKSSLS